MTKSFLKMGCATLAFLAVGAAFFANSVKKSGDEAAAAMTGGDPASGKAAVQKLGCGACHVIPGIAGAYGTVGPPLTQMGSRSYIAGVMKNTTDNMRQWLLNPPGVDHKTAMPDLHLTEQEAQNISAFLYTLK
jgi:cytochrome c1